MHLCSADKNIPWNQVKALIQGRCENTEPFTCAACLASFENICLLHYHCIQHNGTGSYSFDSKTNTAFPRYDYHCKSSLVTDDDFDLDKHGDNVTILYGRPGNFGFNDGSMIDNEEEDKLEENCAECPDEDTDVTNNSHQKDAIGTVQIIDTEENNASTNSIPVEICNVTRTPEGWIVFEIAEDQLNLYNATADIVMQEISKHGDDWFLKAASGVTVIVPTSEPQASQENILPVTESIGGEHSEPTCSNGMTEPMHLNKCLEDCASGDENDCLSDTSKTSHIKAAENKNRQSFVAVSDKVKDIPETIHIGSLSVSTNVKFDKKTKEDRPSDAVITSLASRRPVRNRRLTAKFIDSEFVQDLPLFTGSQTHEPRKSETSMFSKQNSENETESQNGENNQSTFETGFFKNETSNEMITETSHCSNNGNDKSFTAAEGTGLDTSRTKKRIQKLKIKSKVLNVTKSRRTKSKNKSILGRDGKKKTHRCETCGKVGSIQMVRYHEQVHSGNAQFCCDVCNKRFYTKEALRSHMIQHGERKWKCPHCDAAFFKRNYLENHVLKHTGEDPFRHQCDLCGEKFKESYILRRHVKNYHNQIRDFQCRICKRMFFRADSRDQHEQRHYEAYLQCSYCPKKFKAKLDLRKHELTHTGDKQFFCPICMQGFGQIWPYYKHMWRIHNVQKDRAKEMRIKNPAIVNMRNINDEERTCGEEIILPPENRKIVQNEVKMIFRHRKSAEQQPVVENVNQNINQNHSVIYTDVHGNILEGVTFSSDVQESTNSINDNENYGNTDNTETDVTLDDTLVLNVEERMGQDGTIVINTNDIPEDGGSYIMLDDGQIVGSVVICSDNANTDLQYT
ncbi:uncharacterized protein LOC128233558 isoform X2 [Mya arenaria]|nr:uncharacterized protein LOC128233558 isoform X2 [Mya arenaria]